MRLVLSDVAQARVMKLLSEMWNASRLSIDAPTNTERGLCQNARPLWLDPGYLCASYLFAQLAKGSSYYLVFFDARA